MFRGNQLQATLVGHRSCHCCHLPMKFFILLNAHKWVFSCRVHNIEMNFNNSSSGCLPACNVRPCETSLMSVFGSMLALVLATDEAESRKYFVIFIFIA